MIGLSCLERFVNAVDRQNNVMMNIFNIECPNFRGEEGRAQVQCPHHRTF